MSHEGIRITSHEEIEREEVASQPLSRIAVTPAKVRVLLTEGKGLEIDWQDGHQSAWSFAWLRAGCPCASCVAERKAEGRQIGQPRSKSQPTELFPMYAPPADKPLSAQAVGRYALQFHWADGHNAGIYSWDFLRRNCPCRECGFAREAASGQANEFDGGVCS